jgi:hypothetical protein
VVEGPPAPPTGVSSGGGVPSGYGYEVPAVITGDAANVRISCTGSTACKLTLTLSVVEKLQGGKLIAITDLAGPAKRKRPVRKTVVLGSTRVTIAAHKHRTVRVRLNAAGRRLVAKHRLKTKLAIREKGSKTTHTARITFRAHKPVKRKRKRS